MKTIYYYNTKLGKIGIGEQDGHITNLFFETEAPPAWDVVAETPLIQETGLQLAQYLEGERREFDLPLAPEGTEFQKRDWQELQKIAYGTTVSYGEIARALGIPKGARAVGLANNRNPIAILIPCHRVLGADGKLVGYGGGLEMKKALLTIEGCRWKE